MVSYHDDVVTLQKSRRALQKSRALLTSKEEENKE